MKKVYIKPMSEEVKIETLQILAGSFTGNAPDSDDSEFGGNLFTRTMSEAVSPKAIGRVQHSHPSVTT